VAGQRKGGKTLVGEILSGRHRRIQERGCLNFANLHGQISQLEMQNSQRHSASSNTADTKGEKGGWGVNFPKTIPFDPLLGGSKRNQGE